MGWFLGMDGKVHQEVSEEIYWQNLTSLNTLMTEDESVINSRPLTYVHDDSEGISYPLCLSHLLYGQRLPITANGLHSEVISTHETLSKRVRHHRLVVSHFVKRWRNEYLFNLRESYSIKCKHRNAPLRRLRRSIKHLFPLEVNFQNTERESSSSKEPDTSNSDVAQSSVRNTRPRHMAAVNGEMLRRLNQT